MNIGIMGTGVFGIAIASILDKNKNNITMWTKFENEANDLINNRVRSKLNNYEIPKHINITTDIKEVCEEKDIIFIAVPAEFVSSTCMLAEPYISNQHICIASKGIEESSLMFLPDIVKQIFNTNKIGVISGPTFAIDMVNNEPIALALAGTNEETIQIVKENLANDTLKLRESNDFLALCTY